jgi:pilus assembly protein FimV
MVMGQDLCADNELFQGSMVGGLDVDSLAPKAPEMDFDLGSDEAGSASADIDLSLSDEPLELPDMDDGSDDSSDETDAASDKSAEEIGFDLSDTGAEEEAAAEPAGGIEFDISDTGAVEEAAAVEDEFSLDIDAGDLDIDIQDEAEESVTSETDEIQDIGEVDIDFGLDDETATPDESAEEVAIDLTEEADALDLDLGDDSAKPEIPAAVKPAAAEEEDFDLSSLDDVDEVSTKLDLARAYLDMGDHEGTRGILEEVIAEGNDEQKQEANELMSKLD